MPAAGQSVEVVGGGTEAAVGVGVGRVAVLPSVGVACETGDLVCWNGGCVPQAQRKHVRQKRLMMKHRRYNLLYMVFAFISF